jgi:hypothetical protein
MKDLYRQQACAMVPSFTMNPEGDVASLYIFFCDVVELLSTKG